MGCVDVRGKVLSPERRRRRAGLHGNLQISIEVIDSLKPRRQRAVETDGGRHVTSDRHAGLAGGHGHRVEQIDRYRAGEDLDEVIAGRLLSTDHLDGGLCCDPGHHSRRAAPTCRPSD